MQSSHKTSARRAMPGNLNKPQTITSICSLLFILQQVERQERQDVPRQVPRQVEKEVCTDIPRQVINKR